MYTDYHHHNVISQMKNSRNGNTCRVSCGGEGQKQPLIIWLPPLGFGLSPHQNWYNYDTTPALCSVRIKIIGSGKASLGMHCVPISILYILTDFDLYNKVVNPDREGNMTGNYPDTLSQLIVNLFTKVLLGVDM